MANYGVGRVSTTIQVDQGHSMETQEETAYDYARRWDWQAEFPESQRVTKGNLIAAKGPHLDYILMSPGVSASKKPFVVREPEMLKRLKRGDKITTPKLDRMCRNAQEALELRETFRKMGVEWHIKEPFNRDVATGDDPFVNAFFTIASAFAQLERDMLSQRIREVLAHQREKARTGEALILAGHDPGWVMFTAHGYKLLNGFWGLDGEPLVDDEGKPRYDPSLDRQRLVKYACELYVDKKMGPHRIAQHLNKQYNADPIKNAWMRPWDKGPWHKNRFHDMVRNPALIGYRVTPEADRPIPGHFPKVIDEALYERVKKRVALSTELSTNFKGWRNNSFMFLNLFQYVGKCAGCGQRLRRKGRHSNDWTRKRKWMRTDLGDFPTAKAYADAKGVDQRTVYRWKEEGRQTWTYIDPPPPPEGDRSTLLCHGYHQRNKCENSIHILYDPVERHVFEYLRSLDHNGVVGKRKPCVLDQAEIDNLRAEWNRLDGEIQALGKSQNPSIARLALDIAAQQDVVQKKLDAEYAKVGGSEYVPDKLDELLTLYDAMLAESDKEKHSRMRCEIAELLAQEWIAEMPLHDGEPSIDVYFKFRREGLPQDVLFISFTGPGDYVGTVEYGRYDPVTQHFIKLEPTAVDLADAHAAIVTNDPEFDWTETWEQQPPKAKAVQYVEFWKPGWRDRL